MGFVGFGVWFCYLLLSGVWFGMFIDEIWGFFIIVYEVFLK